MVFDKFFLRLMAIPAHFYAQFFLAGHLAYAMKKALLESVHAPKAMLQYANIFTLHCFNWSKGSCQLFRDLD